MKPLGQWLGLGLGTMGVCVVVSVLTLAAGGCGAPAKVGSVGSGTIAAANLDTPELATIDEKMAKIEIDANALAARVDDMQARVTNLMVVPVETEDVSMVDTTGLRIELTSKGVLRVNDVAMSRNDYASLIKDRGGAVCQPSPRVILEPGADYQLSAWLMERIYEQGCSDVIITELNTK